MRNSEPSPSNPAFQRTIWFQRLLMVVSAVVLGVTVVGLNLSSSEVATAAAETVAEPDPVAAPIFPRGKSPATQEVLPLVPFAGNASADLRSVLADGRSSALLFLDTFQDEKTFDALMEKVENREGPGGIVFFRGEDPDAQRRSYTVSVDSARCAVIEIEKIDGRWFVVRCHEAPEKKPAAELEPQDQRSGDSDSNPEHHSS